MLVKMSASVSVAVKGRVLSTLGQELYLYNPGVRAVASGEDSETPQRGTVGEQILSPVLTF